MVGFNRKLVASLACRVNSTRLYAKPLQLLDIERNISVIDYVIDYFKTVDIIDDVVLAVSEMPGNEPFIDLADRRGVSWIVGSEDDVLKRHLDAAHSVGATDAFIITPECPFVFSEGVDDAWERHLTHDNDVTGADALPDGAGFSITKIDALERSYEEGEIRHRTETSLFVREHPDQFKVEIIDVPENVRRPDLRLTVDYPEDLVLCRQVYANFRQYAPRISMKDIITFLDENPFLKSLVEPYTEDPQIYEK